MYWYGCGEHGFMMTSGFSATEYNSVLSILTDHFVQLNCKFNAVEPICIWNKKFANKMSSIWRQQFSKLSRSGAACGLKAEGNQAVSACISNCDMFHVYRKPYGRSLLTLHIQHCSFVGYQMWVQMAAQKFCPLPSCGTCTALINCEG